MPFNTPTEINYLNPVSFETSFLRLPDVSFMTQEVTIPSVALGITSYASFFSDLPIEGDKINFEQLSISFIVAEDLSNYLEIYNWLLAIGFPEDFDQFKLKESIVDTASGTGLDTLKSDMSIIVNTNKSNPNYEIIFRDSFPVSLSSISFQANAAAIEPIIVTANFAYAGQFQIKKLT